MIHLFEANVEGIVLSMYFLLVVREKCHTYALFLTRIGRIDRDRSYSSEKQGISIIICTFDVIMLALLYGWCIEELFMDINT